MEFNWTFIDLTEEKLSRHGSSNKKQITDNRHSQT